MKKILTVLFIPILVVATGVMGVSQALPEFCSGKCACCIAPPEHSCCAPMQDVKSDMSDTVPGINPGPHDCQTTLVCCDQSAPPRVEFSGSQAPDALAWGISPLVLSKAPWKNQPAPGPPRGSPGLVPSIAAYTLFCSFLI